ncbi:MAG: alpha/beta hydrolase [Rhodospirillaceae bacterium]|nr:alpha/beta hydrolase [Rhodospirillaceae bacterium]
MASTAQVRVTKHYATGRFGQVHYRRAAPPIAAAKPALLLFHMSPLSGRIYEKFLGVMGGHRLSIAPDTPGFGDSDLPASPPTIEDYAAAMGDMMDDLKLRQVDVMGYHTGAETCVALALARPHQVRKLILVSAPIFTADELKSFRAHYAHEEINEDGAHLVRKWKGHLHWAGPGWTKELVAQQFPDALRNPLTSWWGHNAAFGYDMAGALAKVTQPVLVLNPDDDLHTQTLRAAPLLKNGRVVHLKGWGHGFQDVRTAEACDLVNNFLDGEG